MILGRRIKREEEGRKEGKEGKEGEMKSEKRRKIEENREGSKLISPDCFT